VLIALGGALGIAPSASASQGSVPLEVSLYASDPDGLVAHLSDLLGVGPDGTGIDFDKTTAVGAVSRVFAFTDEWLGGAHLDAHDSAVILTNNWVAPISIGDKAVGLAIIWINPATNRPELADFLKNVTVAAALADVAADAYVVSDEPRAAWFILTPPTLTTVEVGSSGAPAKLTLTQYQRSIVAAGKAGPPAANLNLGSVLSVGTIVASALLVVLAVLIPLVRSARRAGAESTSTLTSGERD
jgi:hypothetical protein